IRTYKVDARVISATNTDLKAAVAAGLFREDLFYRLNVIHIRVPPLRDRLEDIPVLAKRFIEEAAKKNGREAPLLHPDAIDRLLAYNWPGNIRELQNLMERHVVLNQTGVIDVDELPAELGGSERQKSIVVPVGLPLRD